MKICEPVASTKTLEMLYVENQNHIHKLLCNCIIKKMFGFTIHSTVFYSLLVFWKILEDYDVIEPLFRLNGEVFWKFLEV